jgi:hypothetical protein
VQISIALHLIDLAGALVVDKVGGYLCGKRFGVFHYGPFFCYNSTC